MIKLGQFQQQLNYFKENLNLSKITLWKERIYLSKINLLMCKDIKTLPHIAMPCLKVVKYCKTYKKFNKSR